MKGLLDLVGLVDLEDDDAAARARAARARRSARRPRDARVVLMPRRRIVLVVERNTAGSFLPVAGPIETASWREGLLVVRYHALGSLFGRLRIVAQTVSRTHDEPAVLFEAEKAAAEVTVTSRLVPPLLLIESFTPGPAVRVALDVDPGTGTAAVGTLDVTLSIEVVGHLA